MSIFTGRDRGHTEKLNSLPPNLLPEGVQPTLGPDAAALGQVFWYSLEGRDQREIPPADGICTSCDPHRIGMCAIPCSPPRA
ncbi:MAG: hypothetical protein R3C26_11775 [Calditrichia bacterium]